MSALERSEAPAIRKPLPVADRFTEAYWDGARDHRLMIQRCEKCLYFQHPPGPICRRCFSEDLVFEATRGEGSVYSFTVTYQNFVPGFEHDLPLAIVLVELDEQEGLRVLGNLVGSDITALRVGAEVTVVFEDVDGFTLPQFRLGKD